MFLNTMQLGISNIRKFGKFINMNIIQHTPKQPCVKKEITREVTKLSDKGKGKHSISKLVKCSSVLRGKPTAVNA